MRSIGIDLGTTNTVAAVDGHVLPVGLDVHGVIPSVVAFAPSGEELVGEPARARRPIDPSNTIYSAKRLMGETFYSYRTAEFRRSYPFELVEAQDAVTAFRTRAGDFTARDIATKVIGALTARASIQPDATSAVVTVPAAFELAQRSATRRALRNAGFPDVRMVDEPIATAIAYLQRSNLKHAVVYDLGGGTFDLAVLDCSVRPFRILAHGGDSYLGGDDIDRALAKWVALEVLRTTGWDLSADAQTFDRLVLETEKAKRKLSEQFSVIIDVADVDAAAPAGLEPVTLSRPKALALVSDLVRRTFAICDDVLRSAGLKTKDLDAVFMAGGSTALPGVAEHVQEYFGKRPRTDIPPMEAVAIGASLAAARPNLGELLSDEETSG